jgi:hypothetical protein
MFIPRLFSILFLCAAAATASNLAAFRNCISFSGSGTSCQLDPGIWDVDSTLDIQRNGLTLTGTQFNAADVILRRTSSLGAQPIMRLDTGLNTSIEYLTFDGNRQNISLCSATDQGGVADLDLWDAGVATVQYVNFISAPWRTLNLRTNSSSGASTISYSNFG